MQYGRSGAVSYSRQRMHITQVQRRNRPCGYVRAPETRLPFEDLVDSGLPPRIRRVSGGGMSAATTSATASGCSGRNSRSLPNPIEMEGNQTSPD